MSIFRSMVVFSPTYGWLYSISLSARPGQSAPLRSVHTLSVFFISSIICEGCFYLRIGADGWVCCLYFYYYYYYYHIIIIFLLRFS
ncbi:hypothetical protein B9Z19DRAFT_1083455 [Tuber borchii]|uniref:Uncharacterized protein n=1 Tax=Tuber borchii TaxID=42251 RepID=A0A2T6ZTH4_TUBBO|nr:hypothetical protein B9Z19DRAFT_1083455 [Tuber borchii]